MILNTLFKYYACRCRGRISSPSPAQTAHCRRWDPGVAATFYSLLGNSRECERKRVRIPNLPRAPPPATNSQPCRLWLPPPSSLYAPACCAVKLRSSRSPRWLRFSPRPSPLRRRVSSPHPLMARCSPAAAPPRPRGPASPCPILLSRPDGVSSHIGICHCMGDCVVMAGVENKHHVAL